MLPYQFAAQDLADCGLGQFRAELDVARNLVGRKMFLAECLKFIFRQALAWFEHHPGFDRLATLRVGDAAHGAMVTMLAHLSTKW